MSNGTWLGSRGKLWLAGTSLPSPRHVNQVELQSRVSQDVADDEPFATGQAQTLTLRMFKRAWGHRVECPERRTAPDARPAVVRRA